jgi:hypothetical protein
MKTWRRMSVTSGLVLVNAIACSSSSSSQASVAPLLSGTYKAVTAGSIAQITFYLGSHYALVDGVCANAQLGEDSSSSAPLSSCNELGTYALDAAGGSLTLTPTGRSPRTLPFSVLVTDGAYIPGTEALAPGSGLHVLGNTLTGTDASLTEETDAALVGDGGALTGDAATLVPCPGGALTATNAVPLTQAFSAGGQSLVGGSAPSGTPDPTAGGQWSCSGSFDRDLSDAFYVTSFGCSSSSPAFQDGGDNCCGAGATVAAAAGLCGSLKPAANCSNSCASNSSCNNWRTKQSGAIAASFQCEDMVNYYSTGAISYGIGTRLCLSTSAGKGVVVFVYDDGPSCTIEKKVSAHVLDVSPPTAQHLFGESQISATERKAIFVTSVSASTPLGPNDGCGSAASSANEADAVAASGDDPSGSGGNNAASGDAGSKGDAGCLVSSSCNADSDCNPSGPLGLVCSNGLCQAGCRSSVQCATGTTCVMSGGLGSCQAAGSGTACSNDGACNPGGNGAGMICSGGHCAAGCHASYQCPGNTSCHSGQCS